MDEDKPPTDDLDSTSRAERISELFQQVCDLNDEQREALLSRACAGDAELRAEVESLLAHDETGVLGTQSRTEQVRGMLSELGTNPHPSRVGPYKILEVLGEGGMGIVYVAEQETPVRRRVALKVIKPGMDSTQVLARFEAERQALAMMNHPNVAKVFDAGSTEQGRPYFAMELVKGEPITKHCDRQHLTTQERLILFMHVCEGVQHAHQKGIIHRDIKPTNILVQTEDDKRIPKIIDFGVAKATQQRLTERTLFTEQGVMIGTPEYMSPEQAEMTVEDIDTRTDVYSLGVLLYELLVGALPFDPKELREVGFDEIRRKIREDEPSKPSTRLSTLGDASTESAKRRRTDLRTLRRQLSGDLDWITMRALEKDRARRYGSPSELAADINRHLAHEAVLASPPSRLYRLRKSIRRHRARVAIAAVLVVGLAGFSVREVVQSQRLEGERDRANDEAATSKRISEFLAEMLGSVDPYRLGLELTAALNERGAPISDNRNPSHREMEETLSNIDDWISGANMTDVALRVLDREILERAETTIDAKLADDPLVAAQLRHILGDTYRRLGLYDKAEIRLQSAIKERRQLLGEHPDTLSSIDRLAMVYLLQGRYDEAEAQLLEALAGWSRILEQSQDESSKLRGGRGKAVLDLASTYLLRGQHEKALTYYDEAVEILETSLGETHPETLGAKHGVALVYRQLGQFAEAEGLHKKTIKHQTRILGEEDPDTLRSMIGLAILYQDTAQLADAESMYLDVLAIQERIQGQLHPDTLATMGRLANVYSSQNRYDDAERLLVAVLVSKEQVLGEHHLSTLFSMGNLGAVYTKQNRYTEAKELLLDSHNKLRQLLGAGHPKVCASLYNLACLSAVQGHRNDALNYLRAAIAHGVTVQFARSMATEPDFASLRGDPEFEAIVAEVKKRIGEE